MIKDSHEEKEFLWKTEYNFIFKKNKLLGSYKTTEYTYIMNLNGWNHYYLHMSNIYLTIFMEFMK